MPQKLTDAYVGEIRPTRPLFLSFRPFPGPFFPLFALSPVFALPRTHTHTNTPYQMDIRN